MSDLVRFESRRVGLIEVEKSDIVTFNELPGFPGKTQFIVMEHSEESEMAWLVSMEDPDLAFVVASPWTFFPDYEPPVEREHLAALGIEKKEEVEMLSIVTLSGKAIYLNLAAPLLINATTRRGLQVVSDDSSFSTRAAIPQLKPETAKSDEAQVSPAP